MSDGAFLTALRAGLAERELEVDRALGARLVGELGRVREAAYLEYAFAALDQKLARQAKARKPFLREWLPSWAREVAERWAQRRAVSKPAEKRQDSAGGRCPDCGALWSDGCRCVPGVGAKGRAS